MYLLDTKTYDRVNDGQLGQEPQYAILSHRWGDVEIGFKEYNAAAMRDSNFPPAGAIQAASIFKIRGACNLARSQGWKYMWIDTVCIDKDSSEELRTALNSMFAWYSEAAVCYAYLVDVSIPSRGSDIFGSIKAERQAENQSSEWFERGWTLQELLAPQKMEFYDRNWKPMGRRNDLAAQIGNITSINPDYITDAGSRKRAFRQASVATKMSWMAGRTTQKVEDIAYSMLGILNISITPQYGEKAEAFFRLQEVLMRSPNSFDESLFAWQVPLNGELSCYRKKKYPLKKDERRRKPLPGAKEEEPSELVIPFNATKWGLLAPSPDCFKNTKDVFVQRDAIVPRLGAGFQLTHQGVHMDLDLREIKNRWTGIDKKEVDLVLNCWRGNDRIVIKLSRSPNRIWMRSDCSECVSKRGAKVRDTRVLGIAQGGAMVGAMTVAQPQLQLDYVERFAFDRPRDH